MMLKSVNPATMQLIAEYDELNQFGIYERIMKADVAFAKWRQSSFDTRASFLAKVAMNFRANKQAFAELMVLEMGKTITSALAEVDKCIWCLEYYSENGADHLAPISLQTDSDDAFVSYEPLGVILGVMPWNFPFWQVVRFAAPTLMAGNVVLLKHSSNVTGCSLALEAAFTVQDDDDSRDVFQSLLIKSEHVSDVIGTDSIKGVSVTGSVTAGSAIAEQAGKQIKPTLLELGGSDPCLILPDADLQMAARSAVKSRFINNGQSCIAAKRFIAHHSIAEKFTELVTEAISTIKLGNPMDPEVDLGPLVNESALNEIEHQVEVSVHKGAKVILGGKRSVEYKEGYYFEPTLLVDVPLDSPVMSEEVFGPVASIYVASDEAEMLAVANSTTYGLGAAIWSKDIEHAKKLARRIDAGAVFINSVVASDPRQPFGGIKNSGYGRELGVFGIKEFTNAKTVSITK